MSTEAATRPAAIEPLAQPSTPPLPGWHESLAAGVPGIALLHIERARTGHGRWETAHYWATVATQKAVTANPASGLFHGAPAVAYMLAVAGQPGYAAARGRLERHVIALTRRRLERAHARIDRGQLPALAEYDLINGLTGIGCYLLHHQPDRGELPDVLAYLVRLTEPLRINGEPVPGWWSGHGPTDRPSPEHPTGHGNLGVAHGIAGPLALLATAATRGITVAGQLDVIGCICTWLDQHRHGQGTTAWWPPWITLQEHRTGRTRHTRPLRPSWCYGTPGLARAQQLAGHATADPARQHLAEQALLGCLTDPQQLAQLTDRSLCHGWAGLLQTAWRAAADARTSALAAHLPHLQARLAAHPASPDEPPGLLEGRAGVALARHTTTAGTPITGWDACLLITA